MALQQQKQKPTPSSHNAKKKEPPKLTVITEEMATEIAELAGIHPDDLGLLLRALYRINEQARIARQHGGTVLRGAREETSILDASNRAIERGEERRAREALLLSKYKRLRIRQIPPPLSRAEYPKPVGAKDLLNSIGIIRERLAVLDHKEEERPDATRAQIILKIIELLKRQEAARLVHQVSERQRNFIETRHEEGEEAKKPIGPRYEVLDDETLAKKARRTLQGFDKNLNTLLDEAGDVVHENADAAAQVLSQWIGTATPEKED